MTQRLILAQVQKTFLNLNQFLASVKEEKNNSCDSSFMWKIQLDDVPPHSSFCFIFRAYNLDFEAFVKKL